MSEAVALTDLGQFSGEPDWGVLVDEALPTDYELLSLQDQIHNLDELAELCHIIDREAERINEFRHIVACALERNLLSKILDENFEIDERWRFMMDMTPDRRKTLGRNMFQSAVPEAMLLKPKPANHRVSSAKGIRSIGSGRSMYSDLDTLTDIVLQPEGMRYNPGNYQLRFGDSKQQAFIVGRAQDGARAVYDDVGRLVGADGSKVSELPFKVILRASSVELT